MMLPGYTGPFGVYIPCEAKFGSTMLIRRLECAPNKENIHAGASQVGFFSPSETKWRPRNVASSASCLHVRGFFNGSSRADLFLYIRPK